jgi:hypothetical protein
MNLFQNRLCLSQYLMIPKSQNPVTSGFQKRSPALIALKLFSMLSAIGFDHQPGFKAGKINDIGFNDHLASELESTQPACPQVSPQQSFGIGCFVSQLFGE